MERIIILQKLSFEWKMERIIIITSIDQHGRMLIPSSVREKFNIH
ncbi:hypothetical protein [Rickettsia endosymbiont of Polydrusus tereticollis]